MSEKPGLDALKREQQQELFECIRHFSKYRAFSALNSALAIPGEADIVQENLHKLYEEHYPNERA